MLRGLVWDSRSVRLVDSLACAAGDAVLFLLIAWVGVVPTVATWKGSSNAGNSQESTENLHLELWSKVLPVAIVVERATCWVYWKTDWKKMAVDGSYMATDGPATGMIALPCNVYQRTERLDEASRAMAASQERHFIPHQFDGKHVHASFGWTMTGISPSGSRVRPCVGDCQCWKRRGGGVCRLAGALGRTCFTWHAVTTESYGLAELHVMFRCWMWCRWFDGGVNGKFPVGRWLKGVCGGTLI